MTSVSVAMPTYNGARFLEQQLDSVARQSRLPDELVVSDDGSTDETHEILERFKRSAPFEITVHRNEHRLGWVDNFFREMALCSAAVIDLYDQNDVWDAYKLQLFLAPFDQNPRSSMVVHAAAIVDESLASTGKDQPSIRKRRILAPGSLGPFRSFPAYSLL